MKTIYKKQRKIFTIVIITSSISAICLGLFSIQLGSIFDLIRHSNQEYYGKIIFCALVLFVWGICSISYEYAKTIYGKNIILEIKKIILNNYFSQKISNNNMRRKDEYLNHLVQNLSIYLENFIIPKCDSISNVISVVVSLIIIFLINWKMAFSFILVSLFSILISQLPGKYFTKMTNNLTTVSQVYLREISDYLKSFEQSKLLHIEKFMKNKCQSVNQHFETTRRRYFFSKESSQIFTQFISLSSQMICMVVGIYFIRIEQITLGNLIASIQLLNGVFNPLQVILHQHNQMTSTKNIRSQLNEILDCVVNNNCEMANLEMNKIECQNISLTLNKKQLFQNFSFAFIKNNSYVIVGNSGCGKTTLVKMILGYFDNKEYDGTISINNMKLDKINPTILYKNIGFVCQNDFLFASTVEENIILGRDDALENLNDIKLVVGLDSDFLGKHIKDRNDVSLGEKQRIDLSRILTKKYQVYIFDEPTSNLDPGNASKIIDYILSLKDVIIIVITHDQRPEILQKFDHVINLNNI